MQLARLCVRKTHQLQTALTARALLGGSVRYFALNIDVGAQFQVITCRLHLVAGERSKKRKDYILVERYVLLGRWLHDRHGRTEKTLLLLKC
jgi:hypothetical protein